MCSAIGGQRPGLVDSVVTDSDMFWIGKVWSGSGSCDVYLM